MHSENTINLFVELLDKNSVFRIFYLKLKHMNSLMEIWYLDRQSKSLVVSIFLYLFDVSKLDFKYSDILDSTKRSLGSKSRYEELPKLVESEVFLRSLREFEKNSSTNKTLKVIFNKLASSSLVSYNPLEEISAWRSLFFIDLIKEKSLDARKIVLMKDRFFQEFFFNYCKSKELDEVYFTSYASSLIQDFRRFKSFFSFMFFFLKFKVFNDINQKKEETVLVSTLLKKFKLDAHWSELDYKNLDIFFISEEYDYSVNEHIISKLKELNSSLIFPTNKKFEKLESIVTFDTNSQDKYISSIKKNYQDSHFFRSISKLCKSYSNYYFDPIFNQANANIYLSHDSFSAKEFCSNEVMKKRGGVTFGYQVSFKERFMPDELISWDNFFAFSEFPFKDASSENIDVGNVFVTGFINDCLFEGYKRQSQEIRAKMDCEKIICYFDTAVFDDDRWFYGKEEWIRDHQSLLEYVYKNKNYGLVLKPKKSTHIENFSSKALRLFDDLIEQNRLIIFDGGIEQAPSIASSLSDLTIHSSIHGPTAGVESILYGSKTIFLNKEGIRDSIFHKNCRSDCIFPNISSAINEIDKSLEDSDFGRWDNEIISILDPFRDGKAAKRICEVVNSLSKKIKKGIQRDDAISEVIEEYEQTWGRDKVLKYKC